MDLISSEQTIFIIYTMLVRFNQTRRHPVASLMVMQGEEIGVVSLLLGHANVSITQATYRHVMPGETGKAATLFEEMLNS